MFDLSMQLGIIMIAKQVWNNIMEMGLPAMRIIIKRGLRNDKNKDPWIRDFELNPVTKFR